MRRAAAKIGKQSLIFAAVFFAKAFAGSQHKAII